MPDIYVAENKKKKAEESQPIRKEIAKKPDKPGAVKAETVADKLKAQRTTNPFSALVIRPKKLTFDTQERKEKIILLARRHLITNLRWVLVVVAMIILPRIIFRVFPELLVSFRYRSAAILIWYLFAFSYAFENFLRWFFNVNIITDERVIDIDFPSILYRDISSAKIDVVQDISVKMGGFVRSLFNYGDVHIQTAAEQREFVFEAIPKPEEVIKILNELIAEEEQEKIDGRVR